MDYMDQKWWAAQKQQQAQSAATQRQNQIYMSQQQYNAYRGLMQLNSYYVKETGQTLHGDEQIEAYFKQKFFKKDLEDIINE